MRVTWLAAVCAVSSALMSMVFAVAAQADDAPPVPTPGMQVDDDSGRCTAGFAAQDADGDRYFLTSGHCDDHDSAHWTYAGGVPLGYITDSEKEGDVRDAAVLLLDDDIPTPDGRLNGTYPVTGVLDSSQLKVGMPFCKLGAVSGETCGEITEVDGDVIETSVYSLHGDSGSPGFVKNPDGTVSAVGLLMSSPDGDDDTTYFVLVRPLLDQWGLTLLP